jgi:periplasmic divalent cation tolerance protein
MKPKFVELVLTCGSWQEAQKVADYLLAHKLVACVEFMEIKSKYWWEQKLEEAKEIKLIMESVASNFDIVEKEVAKLHSYETFVLQMVPLEKLSSKASIWLQEVIT